MRFSIVTPSFRQLAWLKRGVRSVADQGVECEHIIQDAGTGPELEEWVREQSAARLFVEKDRGMYDAVNRGFARATGDIFGYLNCDEQYLPGTLRAVGDFFAAHPGVDLLAGDYLITDAEGQLLSYHRATPLRRAMIATDHLYDYSCALFYRRSLWERVGGFRPELRDVGDADWVCRALEAGARPACLRRYLSAFSLTGVNMSMGDNARQEGQQMRARLPRWLQAAAPVLRQVRHLEKLLRGGYTSGPISYAVFTGSEALGRTEITCPRPSSRHPFTLMRAGEG